MRAAVPLAFFAASALGGAAGLVWCSRGARRPLLPPAVGTLALALAMCACVALLFAH